MIVQIEPWIDEAELDELKRVIQSTFVVEHDLTREFENVTKEFTGAKHAIAMCNGTAALFCCLKALGVGENDEVIVPNLTFIASANAVILAGAKPVFCEIRDDTFCMHLKHAETLINTKTKAIMPVHLYGQSCDMDAVMRFAKEHNLQTIEDAAQGVGVKYNNQHVGTFGNCGVLSYYGNKTITCGEGGVVLTNDDEIAEKCYRLKNHGRSGKGVFIHETIGFNFCFTEMQAAVGISQMKKVERIITRKKEIHERYTDELSECNGFNTAYVDPKCNPVYWFTSYLADDREGLEKYLSNAKIQTRRFFYPLHLQPCYANILDKDTNFPVSEKVYEKGISLPSSYQLSDEEQSIVIDAIKDYLCE